MNFHTVKRRYIIAFSSKPLFKRCFCGHSTSRVKVFARSCVENYSAYHKTFQYYFSAYKDKVLALFCMKIRRVFRKYWIIFLPVLSEYRYKIIKISQVTLRLETGNNVYLLWLSVCFPGQSSSTKKLLQELLKIFHSTVRIFWMCSHSQFKSQKLL